MPETVQFRIGPTPAAATGAVGTVSRVVIDPVARMLHRR
jgi:hypothetical protein